MNLKLLAFLSLTVLLALSSVEGGCVCREGGSTLCECSKSFVKPQPKPKVLSSTSTICKTVGAQEFSPIGDVCSCGKIRVAPSQADSPSSSGSSCGCGKKKKQPSSKQLSSIGQVYADAELGGTQFDDATNIYRPASVVSNSKPDADSISIVLASEQLDRCHHKVPEAKLSIGPLGKIVDGARQKHVPDLREGGLYHLAGPRLSLKECKKKQEEDSEDEESEEEVETDDFNLNNLKYDQIGFAEAKFGNPRYVKQYIQPPNYECRDDSHVHEVETVHRDGELVSPDNDDEPADDGDF